VGLEKHPGKLTRTSLGDEGTLLTLQKKNHQSILVTLLRLQSTSWAGNIGGGGLRQGMLGVTVLGLEERPKKPGKRSLI